MIEAVIYGPTPKRITEKFCILPPENKLISPSIWFEAKELRKLSRLTPGIGM
jgi:hypothetical protein